MKIKKKTILAAVLASALSAGCYVTKPLKNFSYQQCEYRSEHDGVKIGVEPLETSEECRSFLGIDVVSEGFLPFYVSIENEGSSAFFIKGGFDFYDSKRRDWKPASWAKIADVKSRKAGLESVIAPGPMKEFMFRNARKWNVKLSEDCKNKILPYNLRVDGNSSCYGILVFEAPEESKNIRENLANGELSFYNKGVVERFKFSAIK